jgi:hypothetical protein
MSKIKPINFPLSGIATELKVKVLNFKTDDQTCTTYNELITDDGVICYNWNYILTHEEFSQWGTDNTYVNQCVANEKGIIII